MEPSMTATPNRSTMARTRAGLMASAVLVLGVACSAPVASVRPTEPGPIVIDAIRTTAALPAARLHLEVVVGMGAQLAGEVQMSVDADLNLASRELAGRATTKFPQELMGGMGPVAEQTAEFIMTRTASFGRDPGTGRWTQIASEGLPLTPTTADLVAVLESVLANPAMTFESAGTSDCSLGSCDHVIAHLDGPTVAGALGRLMRVRPDNVIGVALPDVDLHVLVDRSTSILSELRGELAIQGTSIRFVIQLSNPGDLVQIVPPPAGLIDRDVFLNDVGGAVSPAPTSEPTMAPDFPPSDVESPAPDLPTESP
jgi:hypothetical protein